MKKHISFITLLVLSVFIFVSCNKEHEAVTKVIDVTLKANETYNYQVPATGDADDVMQITKQASHALSTTLDFKSNTSPSAFQYTPAKDYVGSDEVQVSTVETHNQQGQQLHSGGGGCSGGGHRHHDEETTYIFKITIASGNNPG